MTSPAGRLGSALVVLVLAMGPSTGCGDDLPDVVADGGSTASSSSGTASSTGPVLTTTSADTTAGTLDGTGTTAGTSSGDPGTETTQGVTTTDATTDATSSSGTTTDATTDGTSSGGTTTDATTSGATTDMTGATTDMTGGTTFGGTTDGGTTDATGGTTDASGSTGVDTDTVVEVPDFSGDFLMAVATPLDPTLPLQYVASFDFVPSGFGGGTVDVELQPLALDTGSTTTPRTFFGPPLVFPAVPVTADGTFAIPAGVLNVAAETNPLFFVDAQANNVVFSGQVLDADNLCGTLEGMLVFPVASPLTGTTFAAVRVADIMPPGLPVVFPVACP